MRKLINASMALVVAFGFTLPLSGCSEEAGTKTEIKTTTPGGQTTERRETVIDKSGKAPPPAPSENKLP
jgi:hypothetical protein